MPYLQVGLMALLWLVFTVSAASKTRGAAAQRAFAESLRPLPGLPGRWVGPVAAMITVAEVLVVAGLTWALPTGAAAPAVAALVLAAVLLAVFTAGITLALRHRTAARCACFGSAERELGPVHVVRNAFLLAVAVLAILIGPGAEVHPAGALLAALTGAVAGFITIRLDVLFDLFVPMRKLG
ncbi:MauE/DoxX family redox-associated membrane protein [Labedaea rhizosphaerae]|uniref:Methylamine utilisation protein MauE domain-containing protein n=1 Tax=Labedaea rhizosphaerae TaxID=598644 RepID=A0A4V3CZI7_LABRH|nr:MauE/DoxX family redox-associated membrane protein [Labedaea rhizosphaerae]TDP98198.1 hypothetical protein EV186_1031179 [Labedaea rhizosphaerae]